MTTQIRQIILDLLQEYRELETPITKEDMTSQEFYNRFEKEINSLKSPDLDDWRFTYLEVLKAAKRAAGLL